MNSSQSTKTGKGKTLGELWSCSWPVLCAKDMKHWPTHVQLDHCELSLSTHFFRRWRRTDMIYFPYISYIFKFPHLIIKWNLTSAACNCAVAALWSASSLFLWKAAVVLCSTKSVLCLFRVIQFCRTQVQQSDIIWKRLLKKQAFAMLKTNIITKAKDWIQQTQRVITGIDQPYSSPDVYSPCRRPLSPTQTQIRTPILVQH